MCPINFDGTLIVNSQSMVLIFRYLSLLSLSILVACKSNPRYLISNDEFKPPTVYLNPYVDIRYLDYFDDTLLDVDELKRNFSYQDSIENIIDGYLRLVHLDSEELAEVKIDASIQKLLFHSIYKKIKETYTGLRDFNDFVPRYLPRYPESEQVEMDSLGNFEKRILFIYILNAYNVQNTSLDKALETINTLRISDNTDEAIPYLTGFIGVYNIQSSKLEYLYELSTHRLDLYNNDEIDIKLMLDLIKRSLPKGYKTPLPHELTKLLLLR